MQETEAARAEKKQSGELEAQNKGQGGKDANK
jgi:hypothetical protein